MGHRVPRNPFGGLISGPPHRDDLANLLISEIQSRPHDDPGVDGEQGCAQQRLFSSKVGQHSATQITGEQNRAEYRRSRNHVQRKADQLHNSGRQCQRVRQPQFGRGILDGLKVENVDDAVEKHEKDEQATSTYPTLRAVAEGVVVPLPERVSWWAGWVVIGISRGEGERPVATSLAITTPSDRKLIAPVVTTHPAFRTIHLSWSDGRRHGCRKSRLRSDPMNLTS